MQKRTEMIESLKHGDCERIAEITGYSTALVLKVVRGQRKNELIIQATCDYLNMRAELQTKYCRQVAIKNVSPTVVSK